MKYMINICYGDGGGSHPNDDAFVMQKYGQWSDRIRAKVLFAHKLKDGEGRKLEMKKGDIVDGPYIETKESIGGFYVVECASYDEAVQLARECPTLLYQGGFVEVREVEF